jgi:nifR3 family TIM-barrel protein
MTMLTQPATDVRPRPVPGALPGLPGGERVILAPLCGITSAPFRRICLEQGAEMTVTEMVSSEAMTRGNRALCRALDGLDMSAGTQAIQIFGGDAERMGETAAILSEEFAPRYLDMNFGCPVKKIVKGGGGSAVLRDLRILSAICKRVVARSRVPVSAKMRAGWDKPTGSLVRDIARTIEDAGVSMLAVHARTKKQGFAGGANWALIAEAKDAVTIPVVGNGDVHGAEEALAIHTATGCDAVMIGRGAIGNPWVFAEVRARLDGGVYAPPTPRERARTLLRHAREAVRIDGEPYGIIGMRRVMAAYVKHLPGARELRGVLMQATTLAELDALMAGYLRDAAVA